jgi:hypothetical protein
VDGLSLASDTDTAHPGPLDVEILDLQLHVREAPILLVLLQVLQDVVAQQVHHTISRHKCQAVDQLQPVLKLGRLVKDTLES